VERGLIEQSPAANIRPPLKENARDRVLADDELVRAWHAAEAIGFPVGPAVQLLLLTGQRRDEVSHMRWQEINLDNGTWTIPAERNKSGRLHVVPLSTLAISILRSVHQSDAFVFWGRSPDTAINGWSRAKARLDELSGVSDWRLHDLRRTAATGMARLGFDPHVVERVLNHATTNAGPLARVYQRYAYEDEKRAALEAWGAEVESLCEASPRGVHVS
jgi:integrase